MLDNWIAEKIGSAIPIDRAELDKYTLNKLKETFAYAVSNSAFFAERYKGLSFECFEDFSSLPFTTPDDVALSGTRMVCSSSREIDRVFTILPTSGSTGKSKKIYFSSDEIESTIDYFHHGLMEFCNEGDVAAILFPGNGSSYMNAYISEALRRMKAEAVVLGFPKQGEYETFLKRLIEVNATYIIGPPFTVNELALCSRQTGLDKDISENVRAVLLAGSYVSDEHTQNISSLWNCRVDEEYGMTETGLAGAVGCHYGGYHMWESDIYYELIDPETGKPVKNGEPGEIVVTTLRRTVMPFIRYRTGDISIEIPGKCLCGSALRHFAKVGDRKCEKKYNRSRIEGDSHITDF